MTSKRTSVFDRLGGSGGYFEQRPSAETICRNFIYGHCQFGSKCRFSHSTKVAEDRSERRSTNHHSSVHRKHKRHSDLSPDSERKRKRHKRNRHQSVTPDGDGVDLIKSIKKKRLRSPEEGMVSEDGSELEEGQTIDGDDLEQKRVQLQKQLALLQGKTGAVRRNSSSSSSSAGSSSSSGSESAVSNSDQDDLEKSRRKRKVKTSPGPHGEFDISGSDSLYRSYKRQVSPVRSGRSVSPPFVHGTHGAYRSVRGAYSDEHRNLKGRTQTQYNSHGHRSPSPGGFSGRSHTGRHSVGPPGGHSGRRTHSATQGYHSPNHSIGDDSRKPARSKSPDASRTKSPKVKEDRTKREDVKNIEGKRTTSTDHDDIGNGESSNDESISSVLVEEAHMGEDDQEDVACSTTVTNDEGANNKLTKQNSKNSPADHSADDNDDKKAQSPQVQEKELETKEENDEQFSDWSSEEDDLLAKDEDKKYTPRDSPIDSTNNDEVKKSKDSAPEQANGVEDSGMEVEDNLLEEAEAISDDDLEALIEEDNEPGFATDLSEENATEKKFQPAPIYDALEIDWESLVKNSRKPDPSLEGGTPTGACDHWSPQNVLLRIGVSYDLCGKQLAEEVERSLPEKLHSTVAGLHVALSREAAELRDAFDHAGGLYARALSARRDMQLRKRLAAIKESIPDERDAVFEEAVKLYHQIVSSKL